MKTEIIAARPPVPPFTRDTAIQKVRLAEDGWNLAILRKYRSPMGLGSADGSEGRL